MISADQVAQFRERGWLALPRFFTPDEVSALQREIARLMATGRLRNVATDGDGKTPATAAQNLQLCPISPHSPLCRALPFDARVTAAVAALLGGDIRLHLDQVFLKPAGTGAGTRWHQDNAYFHAADPLGGTAMWIAVHDATRENGTLEVLPGVFREPLEHFRDPGSDHHICCEVDEARAVPIELPAGGVAFFCYGTPHCTRGNRTDSPRAGLAFHFLRADAAAPDYAPLCGQPWLTGPQAAFGVEEYGESMEGRWAALVAEDAAA